MASNIPKRDKNRLIPINQLPSYLEKLHKGKLVLVGGCFDVLHKGHYEFLKNAKAKGDTLLIMLESDLSVSQRKGDARPLNTQRKRAEALEKLPEVSYILLLPHLKNDLEYYNLVKTIEPDIIAVTENDPAYNKKAEQARLVGGEIIEVIPRLPYSTSDLLKNQ